MSSILYKELYEKAYKLGRKHRHITAILYKNICIIGKNELKSGRCGHHHDFSVHSEISCLNQFLKQVITDTNANYNNELKYWPFSPHLFSLLRDSIAYS